MVAISFSEPKHLRLLENFEKLQTIRPHNARRIRQMIYNDIQIYWKQRAKGGRKLYDATLDESFDVVFSKHSNTIVSGFIRDGEEFAKRDGFSSEAEMFEWFYNQYGDEMYKMSFDVIRWKPKELLEGDER